MSEEKKLVLGLIGAFIAACVVAFGLSLIMRPYLVSWVESLK